MLSWLFGRKKPTRKVLLIMYDGKAMLATAYPSESGWIARWMFGDDTWSVLLPSGGVVGTSLVKAWLPHSGWTEEEIARCKPNLDR